MERIKKIGFAYLISLRSHFQRKIFLLRRQLLRNCLCNKKQPFAYTIRFIIAAVLISGFFTINIMNLFCTDELYPVGAEISFSAASVLTGAAVLAASALIIFLILRVEFRYKTLIALIAAFALRILFVMFWKIEPTSDFKITLELSKLLHNTPFFKWGAALDSYGTIYNNQWSAHMPFIIFQSFFAGDNYMTIQIVNAFFSGLTCVFTAGISNEIYGKKAAEATLMLSAVNPVSLFYIPVLTNQHISVCFFTAALWVFYKRPFKNNYLNIIICAVLTAISHLIRPEMYIVIIAAAVMCVCYMNKNKIKKVAALIVYIAVFFSVLFSVDVFLRSNSITHQSLFNGNLKYKITVGMNKETGGAWNAPDAELIYDKEALNSEFSKRIHSPSIKTMYGKIAYQFGTYVYPWSMSENHKLVSQLICRRGSAAFMSAVIVMAVLVLLFSRKKRIFPICLIVIGYMAAFSLIEIQARYNYLIIPLLLILSGGALKDGFSKKSSL